MATFLQFAMQQLLFPDEMQLALSLYGCKRPPSMMLCGLIRHFYNTYQTWPGLEELVIYQYTPCNEECEFSIPFADAVTIIMHGIQEYGTIFSCRIIYLFHMYQCTEGRYPRDDELTQETSLEQSEHLTQTMHEQVDEFWTKQRSGIDMSTFPTTIITEDDHNKYECAICQESCTVGQQVLTLPCHHVFHTTSESCGGINVWLERCTSCPLCKKEVTV